jgi:transposase-like protein
LVGAPKEAHGKAEFRDTDAAHAARSVAAAADEARHTVARKGVVLQAAGTGVDQDNISIPAHCQHARVQPVDAGVVAGCRRDRLLGRHAAEAREMGDGVEHAERHDELRRRRRGKGGRGRRSWHVDETYLKVRGRWCYLYWAIDRNRDLVDTMLSEHRDMAAAKAFFRSAKSATGIVPDQVTTDGHGSYPRAIRSTLGKRVKHRNSAFKNNRLEQDHRGIKGRIRCMRGFKGFTSAERFCRGYDELRNHLRPRVRHNQHVSANRRRMLHLRRATIVLTILEAG